MKHHIKITYLLVVFFFLSQIIGMLVVNQYIDKQALKEGRMEFSSLPLDIERPPLEEQSSFWYILAAIFIGTLILLLIVKYKKIRLWKFWYFLSVIITLAISFAAFINQTAAIILALALGYMKIFRPSIWLHNITELFIYGGLAAIFVPIMNVFSAFALLILISIYDMYAVWKSKHMVALAKFTTSTKVFAGLAVPYLKSTGKIQPIPDNLQPDQPPKKTVKKVSSAILGGGDIGFPLLFAGVVMKTMMMRYSVTQSIILASIIALSTSISLLILFYKGEKDKFYPAMPFLSAGCFIGYGLLFVFGFI